MPHSIPQEFSYHFLVDPTPADELTAEDYFHLVNEETIYRISDYPYEEVQADLESLFPEKIPDNWAETYFHWWMERKTSEALGEDLAFYDAVDAAQWEGDWILRKPPEHRAVLIKADDKKDWLTKSEFEKIVKEEGSFALFDDYLNSWDEMLAIAVTAPTPLDKISIVTPPYTVTREKVELYRRQNGAKKCRIDDLPHDQLKRAHLPQAEMSFFFETTAATRRTVPAGGGWLALDYKKGATVRSYFDLKSGRPEMGDGFYLATFEGVSVSLRPEEIFDRFSAEYGIQLTLEGRAGVSALVTATKKYYQIPVTGIVVSGGRPFLELDLSAHPWIGPLIPYPLYLELGLASDFGATAPQGIPGRVLADNAFRLESDFNSDLLLKTAEEMLALAQSGQTDVGVMGAVLPSSYNGTLWLRSLDAAYALEKPNPLFGEEAVLYDGKMRIDFDSLGDRAIEGRLPLKFRQQQGGEDQAGVDIDFRIRTDEEGKLDGWLKGNSDELPLPLKGIGESADGELYFSDLVINPEARSLPEVVSQVVQQFEVQLTRPEKPPLTLIGGAVYAREGGRLYVAGSGDATNANDIAVSWNGTPDELVKNFELSGLVLKPMEGLEFRVVDVLGSYEKNADEIAVNVNAFFDFKARGPFQASKTVQYQGNLVWNAKTGTIRFDDLNIPLPEMLLEFDAGEESLPFLFKGSLKGPVTIDLENEKLTGPFALTGNLYYRRDAQVSGLPLMPGWLTIENPFAVRLPYRGVVYRPGDGRKLRDQALQLKNDKTSNRLQSVEGIRLTVNHLRRHPKSGNVSADLVMDMSAVNVVYPNDDAKEGPALISGNPSAAPAADSQAEPLVVRSEPVGLDDWDLYLDDYGLDREMAEVILNTIRDAKEANFEITGFQMNVPRSRMVMLGGFPFYVPKSCEPVLEMRVVDGKVERFHFYFTKPLGIPPLIRGVYYDTMTGRFRLDLVGGLDDLKRSPELYQNKKGDPAITRSLLDMFQLPPATLGMMLDESGLSAASFGSDAEKWFKFLFTALVEMKKNEAFNRKKRDEKSFMSYDDLNIAIPLVRLNEGAHFSMAGVNFDVGCRHDHCGPLEPQEKSNNLSGNVSLARGEARFAMQNLGRLHLRLPMQNGEDDVFNLMLENGSVDEIVLKSEGEASVLRIGGMRFARSTFKGKPLEEALDFRVISRFVMNSLEVRKEEGLENDVTTMTADFEVDLQEGDLNYREGKREAHFGMAPSHLHVKTHLKMEDRIRQMPEVPKRRLGFLMPRLQTTVVDTVLSEAEFEITSDQLAFSRMEFTPNVFFDGSTLNQARIVLRRGIEGNSLQLEGDFDWKMARPVAIPFAETRTIPRLKPSLEFETVEIDGPGRLTFSGNVVTFGRLDPKQVESLHVSYSGNFSVQHTPDPHRPEWSTDLKGKFEGGNELYDGTFSLENGTPNFPLHVEEAFSGSLDLRLSELNGVIAAESPSPQGLSAFRFVNGTGRYSFSHGHMLEGGHTDLTGFHMELIDRSPRHNRLDLSGYLVVQKKKIQFEDMLFEADVYDEINKSRLDGLKIESLKAMTADLQELLLTPPMGYPEDAIAEKDSAPPE